MSKAKKVFWSVALLCVMVALVAAGAIWHWVNSPVQLDAATVDYTVEQGTSPRGIAKAMSDSGIHINADAFVALARISGQDKALKAGAYEAQRGDTPKMLLERMANGDMTQTRLTLLEGWTYKRIRQALRDDPKVKQTLGGISDKELLARLGSDKKSPEGLFYPDTYVFTPGTSDFDILRRAYHAQQALLKQLWPDREANLPLKTPYQALILASIIEKETGNSADRTRIAGVFINRLRLNMPLQTDPTVIYGMGDAYHGKLHRKNLETDTPWNTYTRTGLPPTPIASAGKASLIAALHPDKDNYLYFVSRGDGTSEFSKNLKGHNRAVAKYILGRNN